MTLARVLATHNLVMSEGSMYERMRRHGDVAWDPHVAHGGLIYDERGAAVLSAVHGEYIAVARARKLPMLVGAATWRANRERHQQSVLRDRRINQDNIEFVRDLCAREAADGDLTLLISAGLGPKGDAYRPDEALDEETAARFHAYQADAFAEAAPDVVFGMTLPAVSEARGIARALEATELPYILSFVVRDTGALLDGTPLADAIDHIDQARPRPPLGYSVNCVHPSLLARGLARVSDSVRTRLIGFRGNTADKTPEELLATDELITEDPTLFAERVANLRAQLSLQIIGGCCGTGTDHIAEIARVCGGAR